MQEKEREEIDQAIAKLIYDEKGNRTKEGKLILTIFTISLAYAIGKLICSKKLKIYH